MNYICYKIYNMKTRFLLPHKCKLIGWILLIPSAILGYFVVFSDLEFKFLELKGNTFSFSNNDKDYD